MITDFAAETLLPRRRLMRAAWCFGLLWIALPAMGGCERMPKMSSVETMRLLTALRTACSAESTEHLEKVRQRVEQMRQDQRLSDAEYEKLREILETAAAGDWEAAEQACFRFQKANSG